MRLGPSGTVTGTAYNRDGVTPVGLGVTVRLSGPSSQTVTTNALGGFQFDFVLFPVAPPSLCVASDPYQTSARLPGRSPVSIHGISAALPAGMSLTRTGTDHVFPWSVE